MEGERRTVPLIFSLHRIPTYYQTTISAVFAVQPRIETVSAIRKGPQAASRLVVAFPDVADMSMWIARGIQACTVPRTIGCKPSQVLHVMLTAAWDTSQKSCHGWYRRTLPLVCAIAVPCVY